METIDLTKVPVNPDAFSGLTPRHEVTEAMQLDDEVNHIEDDRSSVIVIEMGSGIWVSIPRAALVSK